MRRRVILAVVAGAIGSVGLITLAQSQSQVRQPDVQRGLLIAAQGTAAGAVACAQCHAFNGVSDSSGAFPRIAGQSREYLIKQLRDFASGARSNAIMTPIAKALAADDIEDAAAYFAGVNGPFLPLKAPDPALVKVGETLATVGNARRQIQSCNNCHGPGGAGESPAIPYLAGQYSTYLSFALREWQRGYRTSSPSQMGEVAKKLSDQEIAAVAAYYQQARSNVQDVEVATTEQK
jgi:cytochrome c553